MKGPGIHIKRPDAKRCIFCGIPMRETDRGKRCEK